MFINDEEVEFFEGDAGGVRHRGCQEALVELAKGVIAGGSDFNDGGLAIGIFDDADAEENFASGERNSRDGFDGIPETMGMRLLGTDLLSETDRRHFEEAGSDADFILRMRFDSAEDDDAISDGREFVEVSDRASFG